MPTLQIDLVLHDNESREQKLCARPPRHERELMRKLKIK